MMGADGGEAKKYQTSDLDSHNSASYCLSVASQPLFFYF